MLGEKVNFPKVIFYWLQAFKEKFHAKDKKILVPYGMLFIQLMRNSGLDVSMLKPSTSGAQLKGLTFVKMGIAGKQHPKSSNKKTLVSFLRIGNLTYIYRVIHSFWSNIVM